MTESPFQIVNRVVSEDTNAADDLRIIAKDKPGLKPHEREAMIRAADELEYAQRTVSTLYAGLLERDQALGAMRDQLAVAHRKIGALPDAGAVLMRPLSMESGPIPLTTVPIRWTT